MDNIKPLTIIISNGEQTALLINGKPVGVVSAVSFYHRGGECAEIGVEGCNLARLLYPAPKNLLSEALKQIGDNLCGTGQNLSTE